MTCKFYAGMVFGNDLSLLSKPGYHKRVTGVWGFYKLRQHLLQEVMYQLFESRIRTKSGLEIFDKIFFGREVYNLDNIIIVIFQTFMANEFIIYFIRNK